MERYQKGIVVGGTGLLCRVAQLLEESGRVEQTELYFCNENGFGTRKTSGIKCRRFSEKKELMELLKRETKKTLVLSVMNPWIFTKEVLVNPQLLIVNLHHALLPMHRGRNAEAWTIYEGDETAGITWHKVDAGIDTGAVYLQKKVEVDSGVTSLKLLTKLNEAALEGLEELLRRDFLGREPICQKEIGGKMHMAKEIPNGGWLDLGWDAGRMSRFLRAMDYGIMNVLGKPKVRLHDGVYAWKSYEILETDDGKTDETEFSFERRELRIRKEKIMIICKQMKKVEDETDGKII